MQSTFSINEPVWYIGETVVEATVDAFSSSGVELKVNDEKVIVSSSDQNKGCIVPFTIIPKEGHEDMVKLPDLSTETILCNITARYIKDLIYTGIGTILMAINPYKIVGALFSDEIFAKYKNDITGNLPPHIYKSASIMYRNMIKQSMDQCAIISGESGSGKTETSKLILKYLSNVSKEKNSTSNLEVKITATNPILELFGNSKTQYNDNSSRFGKYLSLYFSSNGCLVGADITDYLLEKSRVTNFPPGEQNFHIFYAILNNISNEFTDKWHIEKDVKKYRYLLPKGSAEQCIEDFVHPPFDYYELKKSLVSIELDAKTIHEIEKLIIVILLIGNIEFVNITSCTITNLDLINKICSIFEVEKTLLINILTKKVIITRKESIETDYSVDQASVVRDSLSRSIYANLFSWLIQVFNKTLKEKEPANVIGILDIFGFENFKKNGFEQLCINYANEKLQQYFNRFIFLVEQAEYEEEGIQWNNVSWEDNSLCLQLFENKLGVIDLLNEESNLQSSTSKSLSGKILTNPMNNKHLVKTKMQGESFTIMHYAGTVIYECPGMIEKNREVISEDTKNIFEDSKLSIMTNLYEILCEEEKTVRRKISLCIKFKESLSVLMSDLSNCEPHFIRCIKPNKFKKPVEINSSFVSFQLKYSGILETIKIRQHGYPKRRFIDEFNNRLSVILKREDLACKDKNKIALKILSLSGYTEEFYKLGKTRILMKDECFNQLEKIRTDVIAEDMEKISIFMLFVLHKRKIIETKKQTTYIQAYFKAYMNSIELKRNRVKVIGLQSIARMFIQKRKYAISRENYLAAIRMKQRIQEEDLERDRLAAIELTEKVNKNVQEKIEEKVREDISKKAKVVLEKLLNEEKEMRAPEPIKTALSTCLSRMDKKSSLIIINLKAMFPDKKGHLELIIEEKQTLFYFILSKGILRWYREEDVFHLHGVLNIVTKSLLSKKMTEHIFHLVNKTLTVSKCQKKSQKVLYRIDLNNEIELNIDSEKSELLIANQNISLRIYEPDMDALQKWHDSILYAISSPIEELTESTTIGGSPVGILPLFKCQSIDYKMDESKFILRAGSISFSFFHSDETTIDDWSKAIYTCIENFSAANLGAIVKTGKINLLNVANQQEFVKYVILNNKCLRIFNDEDCKICTDCFLIDSMCQVHDPEPKYDESSTRHTICLFTYFCDITMILDTNEEAMDWFDAIKNQISSMGQTYTKFELCLSRLTTIKDENVYYEYIKMNQILIHSGIPITEPMCLLPYGYCSTTQSNGRRYRDYNIEALDMFKILLEVEGKVNIIPTVQALLKAPLDLKLLRDELYCQLIKQTTCLANHESQTNFNYIKTFLIATITFPPSKRMIPIVLSHLNRFLLKSISQETKFYIDYIINNIGTSHTRELCPSTAEIDCIINRKKPSIDVWTYEIGKLTIEIDYSEEMSELMEKIKLKIDLKSKSTFAIYIRHRDGEFIIPPFTKIYNAMSLLEVKQRVLNDRHAVFFFGYQCVKGYSDMINSGEISFYINCLCDKVLNGYIPLATIERIDLAALYLLYKGTTEDKDIDAFAKSFVALNNKLFSYKGSEAPDFAKNIVVSSTLKKKRNVGSTLKKNDRDNNLSSLESALSIIHEDDVKALMTKRTQVYQGKNKDEYYEILKNFLCKLPMPEYTYFPCFTDSSQSYVLFGVSEAGFCLFNFNSSQAIQVLPYSNMKSFNSPSPGTINFFFKTGSFQIFTKYASFITTLIQCYLLGI